MKPRGLYESIVTQALQHLLEQLPQDLHSIGPLRPADAADRLGLHLGQAVRTALEDLSDADRVDKGIEIANQLLQHLGTIAPEAADRITASVLHAIVGRRPDGSPEDIPSPLIPLRACGRMLHLDDPLRIQTYRNFLEMATPPATADLAERERRRLRMLMASVAGTVLTAETTMEQAVELVWEHPQVRQELRELLDVLDARVSHVQHPLESHPDVPLLMHARYTRDEILAGFGVGATARVSPWQSGVYWVGEARTDLLAFTLDKTSGGFSATTRYRDYAVSREKIHWESQNVTTAGGDTGQRYQHHAEMGTSIMLFARLRADERAFWFLGPGTYEKHEREAPMAITWRLTHPLPGDLYEQFAAAVA